MAVPTAKPGVTVAVGLVCWLIVRVSALEHSHRGLPGAGSARSAQDDIAGPIVRATIDKARDKLARQQNMTVAEKKKTIAQIIDEALEQEFPEEKVETVGKNYNETAKQEDVSLGCLRIMTGPVAKRSLILERGQLRESKSLCG